MTYLVINQIAMGNSTRFGTEGMKLDFIYLCAIVLERKGYESWMISQK